LRLRSGLKTRSRRLKPAATGTRFETASSQSD
jgi:hypothetical protein